MGKVIQFPGQPPRKLGLKRAKRKRGVDLEKFGQLNLFAGRVIALHTQSFFEQALALDESGDIKAAYAFYQQALRHQHHEADALCNLGIIESQLGNAVKAIDYLTQCLVREPRHAEAHYNLANLYSDLGDNKLAVMHYKLAIQINPDFENCYYNLALAYISLDQYDDAFTTLQQYRLMAGADDQLETDKLLMSLEQLRQVKS